MITGDPMQPTAVSGNICPYVGDVSGICWNCRSLCSREVSAKNDFIIKLLERYDFIVVTETRQTSARELFLKDKLPKDLEVFSTYLDQYKGGVSVIVTRKLMDQFENPAMWQVTEQGRSGTLKLSGKKGSLHISGAYPPPTTAVEKCNSIRLLSLGLTNRAHTIMLGDFNFVLIEAGRLVKESAMARLND